MQFHFIIKTVLPGFFKASDVFKYCFRCCSKRQLSGPRLKKSTKSITGSQIWLLFRDSGNIDPLTMNPSVTLGKSIKLSPFTKRSLPAQTTYSSGPAFLDINEITARAVQMARSDDIGCYRSSDLDSSSSLPKFDRQGKISTSISPKNPGGARLTFPSKVYEMLGDAEKEGNAHIVGWLPDGLSFGVFKPKEFVERIMPRYFDQTRYRSFQRQVRFVKQPGCALFEANLVHRISASHV